MGFICGSAARVAFATAAALVAVAVLGASAAGSASGPVDAKHFFWAQRPVIRRDGDAVAERHHLPRWQRRPGAIGVQTTPAVYLVYWGAEWADRLHHRRHGREALLEQDAAELPQHVHGQPRRQPVGRRADAVLPQRPGRHDELRRHPGRGVHHEPEAPAEGRLDRPDAGARRHHRVRAGREPRRRPDRDGGAAGGGALHVRPERDVHHHDAAAPVATGQPAYCGYHTQTTSLNGIGNPFRIEYSFIPWQNTDWPGLGQGCGLHNVNATSNAFGNGIFDSWSIVVGHEYSEAVTDPDNFFAIQDGWNDAQTSENADKCAWTETQNITLGGHQYAVQPTWSNEAFDAGKDPCAVSR